jgi:hypothetical protein
LIKIKVFHIFTIIFGEYIPKNNKQHGKI